jgi:muramidase (phage lysozyme)
MARLPNLHPNRAAFLDALAFSEGTAQLGDDGYNVVVGRTFFHNNYADHPRIKVFIKRINDYSTAAGRYQLLSRYWDAYRRQLMLHGFTPENQDRVALQQIRECKALALIDAGQFDEAMFQCRRIWASLPGANYGQHENSLKALRVTYLEAGGWIA